MDGCGTYSVRDLWDNVNRIHRLHSIVNSNRIIVKFITYLVIKFCSQSSLCTCCRRGTYWHSGLGPGSSDDCIAGLKFLKKLWFLCVTLAESSILTIYLLWSRFSRITPVLSRLLVNRGPLVLYEHVPCCLGFRSGRDFVCSDHFSAQG